MKKVIVIGCGGSGKSVFSRSFASLVGLPLYHLDNIWWREDGSNISREEFDFRLGDILATDEWIIDGNYQRTMERRMAACDTVIFFDLPVEVCLDGAISRIGKARNDMPWIDRELDEGLKKEIEEFREKNLPAIYELLDKYKDGKTVVVFQTREEADEFLNYVK